MEGWWAASYVVMWLLLAALTVVVVALARQIGTLHLRLGPRGALEVDDEGPPLGEAPPPEERTDVQGRAARIGGPGESQLLLFVSPGCHLCEQVLPSLPVVARGHELKPYVLADVDAEEAVSQYERRRLAVRVVSAQEIVRRYRVPGTPYVVVLDALGVVRAKGTVNNLEQLEGLVETGAQRAEAAARERRAS
ncbi:MAG: methylamine dehydrogenase accessory protein MauD [Actinomycetota bacterium]|nr:methylamine dehydrogenase accessory protein MauD [Actinomycetota bacterium]